MPHVGLCSVIRSFVYREDPGLWRRFPPPCCQCHATLARSIFRGVFRVTIGFFQDSFAVLVAYFAYCNRSPRRIVNSGGVWYERKHRLSMWGMILSKHTVASLLNRTSIVRVIIVTSTITVQLLCGLPYCSKFLC